MKGNKFNKKDLGSVIKEISRDKAVDYAKVCLIREITDNNTCTVEPVDTEGFDPSTPNPDNFIYDVKYSPDPSASSEVPVANITYTFVIFLSEVDAFAVLFSAKSKSIFTASDGSKIEVEAAKEEDGELTLGISLDGIRSHSITLPYSSGQSFKGYSKSLEFDYEDIYNRSKCGSIFNLHCDIDILPSTNGKVRIAAQNSNIENKEEDNVKIINNNDRATSDAYVGVLSLLRELVLILFSKQLPGESFKESQDRKIRQFEDLYEVYNSKSYKAKIANTLNVFKASINDRSILYLNGLPTVVIAILKNTKSLILRDDLKPDKPVKEAFNSIYTIISGSLNQRLYNLTFLIYKSIITNNKYTIYYIDTLIGIIDIINDNLSVSTNRLTTTNQDKILELLNKEKTRLSSAKGNNIINYVNEEVNIKEELDISEEITLGEILKDLKDVISDLKDSVKTLANAGVTTPGGPGTFTGLATFQGDATKIQRDLDNIVRNKIDVLLY